MAAPCRYDCKGITVYQERRTADGRTVYDARGCEHWPELKEEPWTPPAR